jgi:UDP-3-O-[3-hydroxymyristoyl] N-acetylglucosamine deacetylase
LKQRTIEKAIEVVGIGLHKAKAITLRLEPLGIDAGIVFYREDIGLSIPLSPDVVIRTDMATVIGNDKGFISTIEHFLSAVYAYGIDNIRVVVNDNEMPIMDGSAIDFCLLLDDAGIKEQSASKKIIVIRKSIEVREGNKFVRLIPHETAVFHFKIDFNHPVIAVQESLFHFSRKAFIKEIARARTFGFVKDIEMLQRRNLALGATLKNAIGLDDEKVLNPEGLRFVNEFARHKVLDAMGDMMLLGHHIIGKYESFAGSHTLNYQLTQKVLASSENYSCEAIEALESRSFANSFA